MVDKVVFDVGAAVVGEDTSGVIIFYVIVTIEDVVTELKAEDSGKAKSLIILHLNLKIRKLYLSTPFYSDYSHER